MSNHNRPVCGVAMFLKITNCLPTRSELIDLGYFRTYANWCQWHSICFQADPVHGTLFFIRLYSNCNRPFTELDSYTITTEYKHTSSHGFFKSKSHLNVPITLFIDFRLSVKIYNCIFRVSDNKLVMIIVYRASIN